MAKEDKLRRSPCRGRAHSTSSQQKKRFEWYSNWKNEVLTCSHCGWHGLGVEAFPGNVGMMECPRCDHGVGGTCNRKSFLGPRMKLEVSYPRIAAIKAASGRTSVSKMAFVRW